MEINVLNIKGQETGRKVTLNDAIFGIEPNDHVIYLDVKQYLANQRQGTAKAKERSEHAGSTRKLGRQKGGGGARHGDINSPLLRGGGRVFGPKPRDYGFKLNLKVKKLARKSALSYKAQENAIIVVEDFQFEAPKTKEFTSLVQNLKVDGKKVPAEEQEHDFRFGGVVYLAGLAGGRGDPACVQTLHENASLFVLLHKDRDIGCMNAGHPGQRECQRKQLECHRKRL